MGQEVKVNGERHKTQVFDNNRDSKDFFSALTPSDPSELAGHL